MSDKKNKILQVLNDNYMVNLFSAQAREHIASKIIENLDGNYNVNQAPEGTVPIEKVVEKKEESTSVDESKSTKPKVPTAPKAKKPVKQDLNKNQANRKRSSLRNLKNN